MSAISSASAIASAIANAVRLADRPRTRIAALAVALALSAVGSMFLGAHPLSADDVLQLVAPSRAAFAVTDAETVAALLYEIRLPRIAAAIGVGAGLSLAGCAFQGLFRNSLVSPGILGASSGAAFGAALALLVSLPMAAVQGAAFVCGLSAVVLACALGGGARAGQSPLRLALAGMVVGQLFAAGLSVVKMLADPESKLPAITFWLMGSLAATTRDDLLRLWPPLVVGAAVLLVLRWPLNLMALGEEDAHTLGLPVRRVRLLALFGATLVTAAAVSVAGIIGWVGLMIPHVARFWAGPNHRDLFPVALLGGALFLLWADNFARTLFSAEFPLGVVTCVCGAPVFLLMLRRLKNGWARE
jgi:iron complex transport system permease protein